MRRAAYRKTNTGLAGILREFGLSGMGAPTSKSKTATKLTTTSITATAVSISQPNSTGTCSSFGGAGGSFVIGGGGFAGRGLRGRGLRSTGGSGASGSFRPPTGTLPKGATGRGAGAFGGVAFGKVTSLSGNILIVVGIRPKFTAPPKGKASSAVTTEIDPVPTLAGGAGSGRPGAGGGTGTTT